MINREMRDEAQSQAVVRSEGLVKIGINVLGDRHARSSLEATEPLRILLHNSRSNFIGLGPLFQRVSSQIERLLS